MFMKPLWGPSGADRTQVGPMLAPWALLSGFHTRGLPPSICFTTTQSTPHELFKCFTLCLVLWQLGTYCVYLHRTQVQRQLYDFFPCLSVFRHICSIWRICWHHIRIKYVLEFNESLIIVKIVFQPNTYVLNAVVLCERDAVTLHEYHGYQQRSRKSSELLGNPPLTV